MSGPDDLVPLTNLVGGHDEPQQSGFDVVFGRGYDRRQVEDYVERVEVALGEADARHAEDAARLAAGEKQFTQLREQLAEAQARAEGRPEPAGRVGERLARMLTLADEEAAEIRARAQAEAQALVQQARAAMDAEGAARTKALEQRERDIAGAGEQADQLRLQAQQDAQAVRTAAQRDAEQTVAQARQLAQQTVQEAEAAAAAQRAQAEQDVRVVHDSARAEAAAMTQEARRQVQELSAQRDAIAAQLQSLRDTLSGAVGPLAGPPLTDPAATQLMAEPRRRQDTQDLPGDVYDGRADEQAAGALRGGSIRTEPDRA